MRLDWHWDGDSGDRLYSVLAGFSCSECSDPSKLDRLRLEFSATIPWLGEERNCNEGTSARYCGLVGYNVKSAVDAETHIIVARHHLREGDLRAGIEP